MDTTTSRLVDFALQANFSALPAGTVQACKRRLIDTFACAFGAYDQPLCQMSREVANWYLASPGAPEASVWGCSWKTTPEAAAFANGVMLRFLDLNDMYRVRSGGHPSDVIAGILAAGEAVHADGASVITAITLAYDAYCSFCDAIDINSKGWDTPVYGTLACALGAGKLLRLCRAQMGEAVSLALAPNMALYQTRSGELSSWKGCAGANASRNGVFAALLARRGFTGPTAVIEGKNGLWDIVGRFQWQMPDGSNTTHAVTRTHLKCFPVCYHGQSAVRAALDARPRVRLEDIGEIHIETYRMAVEQMGNEPSRWAPTTHETADHSLPYVVSIALLDGDVTTQSFRQERLVDPEVKKLMSKITIAEDKRLSAQYPVSASCRLQIHLLSGNHVTIEITNPKGHVSNPMSDSELEGKFRGMFREYGNPPQCDAALDGLWSLDRVQDIGDLLKRFITRPQGENSPSTR